MIFHLKCYGNRQGCCRSTSSESCQGHSDRLAIRPQGKENVDVDEVYEKRLRGFEAEIDGEKPSSTFRDEDVEPRGSVLARGLLALAAVRSAGRRGAGLVLGVVVTGLSGRRLGVA